jgi:hypothetical protein
MEQRDYLKKQLDELGQILGKLLTELLKLKKGGQAKESLEITNHTLKDLLQQDIEQLLAVPDETFVSELKSRKIKNDGLDKLADVLLTLADNVTPDEMAKKLYAKSLLLFEKLESVEPIYSMDRHRKIEKIKKMMMQE